MFWKMILVFTLVPLIELALLIYIGQFIGVLPTVLLVFVTGILGATAARNQGLMVIRDFQLTVQRAQVPAMKMIEGLLILVGAALLVTPGLLSDIAGFLLILPTSRGALALYVADYVTALVQKKMQHRGSFGEKKDSTMDIEWEEDV